MEKLPRWAEKFFSLKCSEGGATCSRPDEDVNGWDYLVEFPPQVHCGPAETTPPISKAFAQVKSTRKRKGVIEVKLSNVLKACRSTDPWFLFLVSYDESLKQCVMHGRHVWTDLMRFGLAEVRKADVAGIRLNRKLVRIEFSEFDRIEGDVVEWMQSRIRSAGNGYGRIKAELSDSLGHEDGYGSANITIEANSEDEIFRAFLGLGQGLSVRKFSFTQSRFGISAASSEFDFAGGRLTIGPERSRPCEIRLRGASLDPAVVLLGQAYGFAPPGLPQRWMFRFSAPPVELITSSIGASEISVRLTFDQPALLSEILSFARIRSWARVGEVSLVVGLDQDVVMRRKVVLPVEAGAKFDDFLLEASSALAKVSENSTFPDLRIRISDLIDNADRLTLFYSTLADASLRVEFAADSELPGCFSAMVYYARISVGQWSFGALVSRRVEEDVLVEGRRRVTAGRPIFLERNVAQGKSHLADEYSEIVDALKNSETLMELGDIISMIETDGKPRAA